MIDWKAVAHHQRDMRRITEQHADRLRSWLEQEHTRRIMLVNAMTELLPVIAGNQDIDTTGCRICEWADGHHPDCPYIKALEVVAAAGRSVEI